MKEFTVKSYPKSELAQLYFPYSEAHVAQNHLNSWIRGCPMLVEALKDCHQSPRAKFYNSWIRGCPMLVEALKDCHQSPRAKFYSAKSVRCIVHFLGEP